MATSNLNYLEESRPPDLNNSHPSPRNTMGCSSTPNELPLAAQHLITSITSPDVNQNPSQHRQTDINCNRVDIGEQCNLETTPRTFNKRETRRPVSAPERKRNSYHCDVEEALSSLLWQPYEYQTRSDSSDTLSSTISSSSSSEYLATLLSQAQTGNNVDPNLSLQMVTNLMALNPSMVGARANQWAGSIHSRDRYGCAKVGSTLSRLSSNPTTVAYRLDNNSERVFKCSDYEVLNSVVGDMRLEIGSVEENKPPDENETAESLFVSTDMIPSNMTSVVSANVVGLPVAHSRSSSNISSNRNTERNDVVNHHPRSASEVLVLGSHFRSTTNLQDQRNAPIPSHPRQASSGSLRGGSEPPKPTTNNEVNLVLGNQFRSSTNLHISQPRLPQINITHASESRSVQTIVPQSELELENSNSRIPPLPNVSNVNVSNVNYYRAVPVNIVSNVPTINCLNSIENTGNNVSNVHIVQAMPATITTSQVTIKPSPRTFTSTEAQTDDTTVGSTPAIIVPTTTREQRRRERRERRHQRRMNQSNHQHISNDRLPDLLNSHLPPPYTTLPAGVAPPVVSPVPAMPPPPQGGVLPYQVPLVPGPPQPIPVVTPTGFRFSFPTAAGFRR